jgi:hypothetical protein
MRSIGAGAAGGVGEVMADYITKGHPPFDMYNLVKLRTKIHPFYFGIEPIKLFWGDLQTFCKLDCFINLKLYFIALKWCRLQSNSTPECSWLLVSISLNFFVVSFNQIFVSLTSSTM